MNHPSSLDLEALACGELAIDAAGPRMRDLRDARDVAAHVDECPACGAFVQELSGLLASSSPSAAEADAIVARALSNVARGESESNAQKDDRVAPTNGTSRSAAEVRTVAKRAPARLWLVTTSIMAPLAAAAAILLLARSPQTRAPAATQTPRDPGVSSGRGDGVVPAREPDRILMAPFPGSAASPREPDTTFKGGMQIAVVRERAGQQARFASGVRVRPGDRLRVEVALDREQAIVGAVLADDGSYLELMPSAIRGVGTHFSEKSAKIDATPTYGTLVIGTPEAVARARATRQLDGVTSLRVESEVAP